MPRKLWRSCRCGAVGSWIRSPGTSASGTASAASRIRPSATDCGYTHSAHPASPSAPPEYSLRSRLWPSPPGRRSHGVWLECSADGSHPWPLGLTLHAHDLAGHRNLDRKDSQPVTYLDAGRVFGPRGCGRVCQADRRLPKLSSGSCPRLTQTRAPFRLLVPVS